MASTVSTTRGLDGGLDVEEGEHEHGGVELGRAVGGGVGVLGGVEPSAADVVGERVAGVDPSLLAVPASVAPGRGDAGGAVEGQPRHELGVDVVGGVGPLLPDPGVGFGPGGGDLVGEGGDGPPRLAVQPVAGVGEEPGGVDHPAVAVELMLAGGAVADAYRATVGVAGPAVELASRRGRAARRG